jgi:hypothetical protein
VKPLTETVRAFAPLLLFLDDLMPSLFGKSLLTHAAPENRQIAW